MTTVAVVGTGSAGRRHLTNLARLGVTDLVAVSTHSRRTELDAAGVTVDVVHDYDTALDRADAVVIANPTSLHLDHVARAISAGRHVLCEKPVATTAVGLDALADDAERAGLTAAVGCQFRFNRLLGMMRDRILAGDAGTVVDVDAMLGEHLADYHPDEDYRQSYAARRELGGGVLLTQIHQFDYLHWLFGPFERAFAVGGRIGGLGIDVEDSVSYLLRSSAGVPVRAHLDYLQRPRRLGITVTGTTGRLGWDYLRNELSFLPAVADATPELVSEPFDRNQMFVDLMADFLDAVRTGRPPRTTLRDAGAVLQIVDAVRSSMEIDDAVAVGQGACCG